MNIRLQDCVILHASDLPECTAEVAKRFVGYSSLQHVSSGAVVLSYNRQTQQLGPGWIWPCNPGPWITFHAAPGHPSWHHHHVALRGPLLDHWRSTGMWPIRPQFAPEGDAFTELFQRMVADLRDPVRQVLGINLLERILLLLALARREPVAEPWVDRAKRLLAEPDGFRRDIDTVAEACRLPLSTFRRRFQQAVGVSPQEFALSARVDRARKLLVDTGLSIGAIADRLGYQDVFFFSRQFTRRTGMSPSAYRNSALT